MFFKDVFVTWPRDAVRDMRSHDSDKRSDGKFSLFSCIFIWILLLCILAVLAFPLVKSMGWLSPSDGSESVIPIVLPIVMPVPIYMGR